VDPVHGLNAISGPRRRYISLINCNLRKEFLTLAVDPTLKNSSDIRLKQTQSSTTSIGVTTDLNATEMLLSEKIDEYIFRLGYSNTHTLGIVIQLLVTGKVRVDFRDHYERLQLARKSDVMDRTHAVDLFDRHLESHRKHETQTGQDFTQKIIIESPAPSPTK